MTEKGHDVYINENLRSLLEGGKYIKSIIRGPLINYFFFNVMIYHKATDSCVIGFISLKVHSMNISSEDYKLDESLKEELVEYKTFSRFIRVYGRKIFYFRN